MKKKSPLATRGGICLGILLAGLAGTVLVATNSSTLRSETHSRQFLSDPDGALGKMLTRRNTEATASDSNDFRHARRETREQFESDRCYNAEMPAANAATADGTDPTPLGTADLNELLSSGTLGAALMDTGSTGVARGGAGLQFGNAWWAEGDIGGVAAHSLNGKSGKSGGTPHSSPRGNGTGVSGPGSEGLLAAEFGDALNLRANNIDSAAGIHSRNNPVGNFSRSAPFADARHSNSLVLNDNPQSIVPPRPVPDGGTSLLLLSLSLGGLGLGKRWISNS